jgi:hypothetical protein
MILPCVNLFDFSLLRDFTNTLKYDNELVCVCVCVCVCMYVCVCEAPIVCFKNPLRMYNLLQRRLCKQTKLLCGRRCRQLQAPAANWKVN